MTNVTTKSNVSHKATTNIRVWLDGCFDMFHFGHANAIRQASALGNTLVVGVHSDAEIRRHKGRPVMAESERYRMVRSCRWVDEVVEDAPYIATLATLDLYGCAFCVHGDDDVITIDGRDAYAEIKDAGRYRTIPRTPGISTTALLHRLLARSPEEMPNIRGAGGSRSFGGSGGSGNLGNLGNPGNPGNLGEGISNYTGDVSMFWLSSEKIVAFAGVSTADEASMATTHQLDMATTYEADMTTMHQLDTTTKHPDTIIITPITIYIDGSFDMFHVGHVSILKAARALGTRLVVGLWSDEDTHQIHGACPVMTAHERFYAVLGCRFVDNVVLGAPQRLTAAFLDEQGIDLVATGSVKDPTDQNARRYAPQDDPRYQVARDKGAFQLLESPSRVTMSGVIERVLRSGADFRQRNRAKEEREAQHLAAEAAAASPRR